MKQAITIAIAAASLTCASHAAITVSLPGNSETEQWSNLTSANHPGGFPAAADTGAGLAGNGVLNKVAGAAYFGTFSLYNGFSGSPSTFTVSSSTALTDIQTVVFQIDGGLAGSPFGATLSFNGGAQSLAADFFTIGTGDYLSGQPGGPQDPTTNLAFQWDLSGVVGNVTSYEISWTSPLHTTAYQINAVAGEVAAAGSLVTQSVPEPSAALLTGLAGIAVALRRRRA